MSVTWQVREEDREFFARELDSFVPLRVYDAHAHLWRARDWEGQAPPVVQAAPPEMTLELYRDCMGWILPGREVHGLHLPFPTVFPNDPGPCNDWVSRQMGKDPLARGHFYVRPADDPEWVRQEVKRLGMRGFKPFAGFVKGKSPSMAEIPDFFPEWMARLAGDEGWSVTLHMQRPRSLADPSNQHWVRTWCERYPGMMLILDHCARGFNPHHAIAGLEQLKGLPNLYVDTSVACSPLAVMACIRYLGAHNVLYGSDFWCSHLRGTNLPVADSFVWLDEDAPVWDAVAYGGRPVLLGLENLRAIKAACQMLSLSDRAVEGIFWDNAARLLGL